MIHPRNQIVTKANIEISQAVMDAAAKHKLSFGEVVLILSDLVKDMSRGIVQRDRHPGEPDKSLDEA